MPDEIINDPIEGVTFPLRYRILGRMPSIFAQNLLIQSMPESVLLSFFETILPQKLEMTPDDLEELKETGLLAECVARIMLPPQAFLQAADAMQRVADVIRKKTQAEGSENA